MGKVSLDDIIVTKLSRIPTPGGDILHYLKRSDKDFEGFGEAYFSWVDHQFVKAWKRHNKMTMNVVVPVGQVKFVFFIDGSDIFRVEEIGIDRYVRLTVPPGICFGFQGIKVSQSLIVNIASIPHDPDEVDRFPLNHLKYNW